MNQEYLKLFKNQEEYDAAATKPVVSHLVEEVEVKMAGPVEKRLICIYSANTTSSPIQLISGQNMSGFTSMEIDGIMLPNVVSSYTFTTLGEHTVKLGLEDETTIGGARGYIRSANLIETIIPSSVKYITTSAYHADGMLKKVTLPDGLIELGQYSFYGCSGLTEINIPRSVTLINSVCFSGCKGLTRVICNPTTPPRVDSAAFNNTNDCPIYVPAESVNLYKTTGNWVNYASRIQAIH